MPTVSYDGQSFLIDNRRVWLVAGTIAYVNVPPGLWRARLRAAKDAGLNCIDAPVMWSAHARRDFGKSSARIVFEGQTDIRAFVQIVAELGMHCIVRAGPYAGGGWDFGGLPAWLHNAPDVRFREANGPFLEGCSKFLTALMEQLKDLQVTRDKGNGPLGPIVAVQIEGDWHCHNPAQGDGYLGELARYLRENGCNVPILESTNLWQPAPGTLPTWKAQRDLAAHLRQFRLVHDHIPRLVTVGVSTGQDTWGGETPEPINPDTLMHRLAQVLAGGGQYRLEPFHGGTHFGFNAGRLGRGRDSFVTTSADGGAPLSETGERTERYYAVKRISTFASQFAHVLAHVEPEPAHAAVSPLGQGQPVSVIHQIGAQGDVIFLLRDAGDDRESVDLLLPDGQVLTVPLGDDRVAWLLLNANLGGVAELTYTNLRPWAFIDRRLLVVIGPAGAEGVVAINDGPAHVTVPSGQTPHVEHTEDVVIAVLSNEMADAAVAWDKGLIVGAAGLDDQAQPIAMGGWSKPLVIKPDGELSKLNIEKPRRRSSPNLGEWQWASLGAMIRGESDAFKPVEAPADLAAMGVDAGYGWYRLSAKAAKTNKVMAPDSGDRLHVFSEGKPVTILGVGHGATDGPEKIAFDGDFVFLADNLGRYSAGWQLGEHKGLFGDLYDVKTARLTKPKLESGNCPDPFHFRGYWAGLSVDEHHPADTLVWKFKPVGRQSVVVELRDFPLRAMVFINDEPRGMISPDWGGGFLRLTLHVGEQIKGGQNELRLALFEKADEKLDVHKCVTVFQTTANLTKGAEWSFAPWVLPGDESFEPMPRSTPVEPCWYRTTFNVSQADAPLWLEPRGMSKGQVYLNRQNAGRYFLSTVTGKSVGPQKRYYLPQTWLKTDGPNELLIFDEHGKSPEKCVLKFE